MQLNPYSATCLSVKYQHSFPALDGPLYAHSLKVPVFLQVACAIAGIHSPAESVSPEDWQLPLAEAKDRNSRVVAGHCTTVKVHAPPARALTGYPS